MRTCISALMLLYSFTQINAQEYRYGDMIIEKPGQVIVSNFTGIPLPVEDGTMNANRFNPQNAYTYLQMIYNEQNNVFQLLIQTDFYGRIIYAGYSNNLFVVFSNKSNTINIFNQCLKQVNSQFGTLQKMQRLLACFLEQLNYFGES